MKLSFFLEDETALIAFSKKIASALSVDTVIYLQGQLGAGKTTLVRGILRALGYTGTIRSPTYTLVEIYELAQAQIFHLDLYRLHHPQELEYLGIWEQIDQAIFLIEWPEHGLGFLPLADLRCEIILENQGRRINLRAVSEKAEKILRQIKVAL